MTLGPSPQGCKMAHASDHVRVPAPLSGSQVLLLPAGVGFHPIGRRCVTCPPPPAAGGAGEVGIWLHGLCSESRLMGMGAASANPKASGGAFFLPQDLVLWGGGKGVEGLALQAMALPL